MRAGEAFGVIRAAIRGSRRLLPRGRGAVVLAVVLFVGGVVLSLLVASTLRANAREHERQALRTVATDTTATIEQKIESDVSFIATTRALMTMQPKLTPSGFAEWYSRLEGRRRQLGSLGTTVTQVVPAGGVRAFLARRNADPAFRAATRDTILPFPQRGQRRACLMLTTVSPFGSVTPKIATLLQGDWCDRSSPIGANQAGPQRIATDTGQITSLPVYAEHVHTVFFVAAYYRRGAPIATSAQRRAAVTGWISSSFDLDAALRAVTSDQPGLSVSLFHSTNAGEAPALVAELKAPLHGGYRVPTSFALDGVWKVLVRGRESAGTLSPTAVALLALGVGVVVSALVAALVLSLGRSRERALGLVEEKTGQLRYQALHDALTGLPNRVLVFDRTEQLLARARRAQGALAVLYIDLDGFKIVNDTYGHAAGDELLRTVAERLKLTIRASDTAARLGGDEFVVLVESSSLDAGPELVAERMLAVLREPYDIAGRPRAVTASIGIATGFRDSAEELFRDADIALYEAKDNGRDCYVIFNAEMHTVVQDRVTLEMDLADALERNELFLVYQPTVDLHTQAIVGAEALIRWRHPDRGELLPGVFIPLAEKSHLIVPIGRWVLHEACEQAARWSRAGHDLGIAVNVAARQLDGDGLLDDVRHALDASGLEPDRLTLEVTETTLMRDAAAAALRLRSLKRLGVSIAIDDFGTGYSSLAYLQQFPADLLKIDRTFVQAAGRSQGSSALLHALVQLSSNLHLATLAEGIEEQGQLDAVRSQDCDYGQGYLFSRPLGPDRLQELLTLDRLQRTESPAGVPGNAAA